MKSREKNAVITGATSGIGYQMAKILHTKGYSLWLTGRNLKAIEGLKIEFPSCNTLSADLSKDSGREDFWKWIGQTPVDLMINNAGYGVKSHLSALKTLGVTPIHRRTFKPIHNILLGKKK